MYEWNAAHIKPRLPLLTDSKRLYHIAQHFTLSIGVKIISHWYKVVPIWRLIPLTLNLGLLWTTSQTPHRYILLLFTQPQKANVIPGWAGHLTKSDTQPKSRLYRRSASTGNHATKTLWILAKSAEQEDMIILALRDLSGNIKTLHATALYKIPFSALYDRAPGVSRVDISHHRQKLT